MVGKAGDCRAPRVRRRAAWLGALALTAVVLSGCVAPEPESYEPPSWNVPQASGSGRRIVYRLSTQQAWLVEDNGAITDSFLVSGNLGGPPPGQYYVHRKLDPGYSGNLTLPHFVGFAWGATTDIGFHGIPLYPDGTQIQSDAELGTPLSHGCVRVAQDKAWEIWNWADIGTSVVVVW